VVEHWVRGQACEEAMQGCAAGFEKLGAGVAQRQRVLWRHWLCVCARELTWWKKSFHSRIGHHPAAKEAVCVLIGSQHTERGAHRQDVEGVMLAEILVQPKEV
jgi:hypothetical protein